MAKMKVGKNVRKAIEKRASKKAETPLLPKVQRISELRMLATTTMTPNRARYEKLMRIAASNLGYAGNPNTDELTKLYSFLSMNADETSEEGVVGEINYVRDLEAASW